MKTLIACTLLTLGSAALAAPSLEPRTQGGAGAAAVRQGSDPSDPQALLGLLARERAAASPPADAGVIRELAADLTAGRRTLDDAWKWARDEYGDRRALLMVGLGGYVWGQATSPSVDPRVQPRLLDLTGRVLDLALDESPGLPEAMALKALLLRQRAQATRDLDQKTALLEESTRLSEGAAEIYRLSHAAPAAP